HRLRPGWPGCAHAGRRARRRTHPVRRGSVHGRYAWAARTKAGEPASQVDPHIAQRSADADPDRLAGLTDFQAAAQIAHPAFQQLAGAFGADALAATVPRLEAQGFGLLQNRALIIAFGLYGGTGEIQA